MVEGMFCVEGDGLGLVWCPALRDWVDLEMHF